ncbi:MULTISPECIES: ATP-dependent RNA helicase [Actinotignum]|uniref:ATP-dependent helicase C-terminal domain-containing protein n=11 Tax=Bacillati TaxID=1783272 RepID=A0AAW9HPK0_9ACTO|nr:MULTISPECIES: ATP-dependent helicase C-terminal domain-containing protein [Actinotignum]MBS5748084.1 ATP-dependent helicase HrpB [Actinotignum schaalii]MDE1535989.1 ATP-dependent helicase C-terminal domain-containing protein [Actinotignum schaalii]MDE1559010.1 ATP-dependent helicase C-terminal domain-containing protein [Actinotignum schaalii]MDE1664016.1 ATP-dependent helicase C-terminal domain-containing protein [Actinotignum schaalii]MDK6373026.1 ATP-dependent helicase C-terminal domain-c
MTSDPCARLLAPPPSLPVAAHLDEVRAALPLAVVSAPPGTGKTTLIPPLVACALTEGVRGGTDAGGSRPGRVLVIQPRRVAARAAARRLAELFGEPVGASAGYSVRGDSQVSRETRIEMITPGIAVRRLQSDPELRGIGALIFDEVHERHLDADLALALALEARAAFRPDLLLVAMSATVESQRTAALLEAGAAAPGEAPRIVDIPGVLHPLTLRYAPPGRGEEPLGTISRDGALGVRREFLAHVARVVERAFREVELGDILVFLPGVREVEHVVGLLGHLPARVAPLHGSLTGAQQDAALREVTGTRSIIVTTAIAESSLTVPGVRIVVDSGLSREPRTDYASGISGLVTVLESQAAGIQRGGRAGRLGPGTVYRVMSEATWARLSERSTPEIYTADLTDFLLQAAVWGAPEGRGLALLDPPPQPAVAAGMRTLTALGCVVAEQSAGVDAANGGTLGTETHGSAVTGESTGVERAWQVTDLARTLAPLPVSTRLGRSLLETTPRLGAGTAAQIVAALAESPRLPGADLARWPIAVSSAWARQAQRLEKLARRALGDAVAAGSGQHESGQSGSGKSGSGAAIRGKTDTAGSGTTGPAGSGKPSRAARSDDALALVTAWAYPDLLARAVDSTSGRYLLANGSGAVLPQGSPLLGTPWLAVAEVSASQGRADALIRAAVPADEELARQAGRGLITTGTAITYRKGRLRARETTRLGAIELSGRELERLPRGAATAWVSAAASSGTLPLEFTAGAQALRERLAFLHTVLGEPWPDMSETALRQRIDELAGPELAALARGGTWGNLGAGNIERLLPWPEATHLDELAPASLTIPTGEQRTIHYEGGRPTVRLRVQEAFGWTKTPRLAGGRIPVTLELLSPAARPVAITDDLESFWAGPYAQVRAEMRGRYPRHPWPENGATASPTKRARPRRPGQSR